MGKHIVDLDWYFEKTTEVNRALDFKTAKNSLGDRELLITTTNARDRKPYYLSPTGDGKHWRELLKASSALPFLYKQAFDSLGVENLTALSLLFLCVFLFTLYRLWNQAEEVKTHQQ